MQIIRARSGGARTGDYKSTGRRIGSAIAKVLTEICICNNFFALTYWLVNSVCLRVYERSSGSYIGPGAFCVVGLLIFSLSLVHFHC